MTTAMLVVAAPGRNKLGVARVISESFWQAEAIEVVFGCAQLTPNTLMGVSVTETNPLGTFLPVTQALIYCDDDQKTCLILDAVESLSEETADAIVDYLTANPKEKLLIICLSGGEKPVPTSLYQFITGARCLQT